MRRLVLAYLIYALVASGLLALNVPRFEHADEVNHMLRAEQVSRLRLVGERFAAGRNSGGFVSPGIEAAAGPFDPIKFHPEQRATSAMFNATAGIGWRGDPVASGFANTSIYPPFLYAPSVLAIWAGKVSGLTVIRTLYLARLLTGLACASLVGLALLLCLRRGQVGAALAIFVLATFPMSFALANSCSQDGLMLGVAALGGALLARVRISSDRAEFAGLCFCLALLAMARPPYLPLALIPMATEGPRRRRMLGAASVGLAGLGWAAIAAIYAAVDLTAGRGANVAAQLRVLAHPGRTVRLFADTLVANGGMYVQGFIGRLGWLDTPLPNWFVAAASALLLAVAVSGLAWSRPLHALRWPVAATVLSVVLTFVSLYLLWTPVGDPVIDGVQGRYFLPLALLGAGLVDRPARSSPSWQRGLAAVAVLFPALGLAVTMRALILRYYGPV